MVTYAAAVDVAKGFGMVCTRVPGSRLDRKRQAVWRAGATYDAVVALMDHLRCQGIQRLVLESTSDYWRIWYYLAEAAGLEVWLAGGWVASGGVAADDRGCAARDAVSPLVLGAR